ncbi:hypothetical protein [Sulfurimonas autotrophica]|uniref:Rod shape-determining protein MreD n=1 Tax=Sulfurimonas autotrophica (strain ATCC BAA-671 / DSM 16294 / JCM 11897 / OK10) TaxID=563040 RepID=E0USM8_SULAO|nr:hypothetical protein [Sulfurimonas autotrophica]ADN09191.1 conserved hypothetical protein [Sulfurimonas autotrophica DSM 16294]
MQRSISHQKPIIPFLYIILFVLYDSLGSIYPFLPPLLAVLYVLFSRALDNNDTVSIFLIVLCLVVFEANYGYILLSSVVYFYIVYKFIMPKIIQNSSCATCIRAVTVILIYLGFFLFLTLLSNIFLLPQPSINYYIIYYIVIEFFLVSLL